MLFLTGGKNEVKNWNVETGKNTSDYSLIEKQVNTIKIYNDNMILIGSNPTIQLFSLETSNFIGKIKAHEGNVLNIDCSRNNEWILTSSDDGFYKVFDMRTSKCTIGVDVSLFVELILI